MQAWAICILVICLLIIFILIAKLFVLKLAIHEINRDLQEIKSKDTNSLLTISSRDKDMRSLVQQLNIALSNIRDQELRYQKGNYEIQNAITNVAHDLRTPLTAILGFAELLDQEPLSEQQKQSLNVIQNRALELLYLSNQLFNYMYHKDQEKMVTERVCLNEEIETALLNSYALLKEKEIQPILDITPIKIYRHLNKEMLTRILDNLIHNAVKYGGKNIKITLSITGKLTFSNPAPELDSVGVQKIFDKYYTLENARKVSGGAGLAIVKQFVELNQGIISAKLEDGWLVLSIEFFKREQKEE